MRKLEKTSTRGFTLLEVLIATVITAITIAAVATVMRTGAKAWDTGHNMSELYETARIAEDVIVRDLDNITYQNESNYNRAFHNQIYILADRQRSAAGPDRRDPFAKPKRKSRAGEGGDAWDDLSMENIAPPVDLSFHGTADSMNFARTYQPRFPGDDETWGLRRVTYFVRDKVLYRKEKDPYGAPPLLDSSILDSPDLPEREAIRYELEREFYRPDDIPKPGEESAGKAGNPAQPEVPLPSLLELEEPLCEGVEIFKLSYGFFRGGEWEEVQDWDSSARRHRNPPIEQVDPVTGLPITTDTQPGAYLPGGVFVKSINPDDLPGYVALQIGLRPKSGKGKIHSFTIFYSLAPAQETDIFYDESLDQNKPIMKLPNRQGKINRRIKPI